MTATSKDLSQALEILFRHRGPNAQLNISLLGQAVQDGRAKADDGFLVVCNDANRADPRFSIRTPGGEWL